MNSLIFIGVLAFRKNDISNKNILLVNYSAFIFLLIGLYFAIDFLDAFANAWVRMQRISKCMQYYRAAV